MQVRKYKKSKLGKTYKMHRLFNKTYFLWNKNSKWKDMPIAFWMSFKSVGVENTVVYGQVSDNYILNQHLISY